MNRTRPQIDPLVMVGLIDSLPGRVRKRLDNEPHVANKWDWSVDGDRWTIVAGEETVELNSHDGKIASQDQVRCSCLLTPNCFHLIACVSLLSTSASSAVAHEEKSNEAVVEEVLISNEMRAAASLAQGAVAAVLKVGARRAGLLVQSGLLRAAHQCRANNLISLGNSLLRIVAAAGRLRSNDDTASASQLRDDLAIALTSAHIIIHADAAPRWMIGQSRRTFEPVDVRKLEGVCAEPILTLSGYAGVCVYLQSSTSGDDGLFTVNELRPGDSQLILQAYSGGVDVGAVAIEASALCRSTLAVQNLQASSDQRLGKGKSTQWALQSNSKSIHRLATGRFGLPLEMQVEQVFRSAKLSEDQRCGGWDLVAFDGKVIGPRGASLLVEVPQVTSRWRLKVAIDDTQLAYRDNLHLLARCPGLSIRCLGRMRLDSAGEIDLLAIENVSSLETADALCLALPESWQGLCNVGLDRLQRHHLQGVNRWSDELSLAENDSASSHLDDGLGSLRRRLDGIAIGGRMTVPAIDSRTHRRDRQLLGQNFQNTASQLYDVLARSLAENREASPSLGTQREKTAPRIDEAFLSCAVYMHAARIHFEHCRWLQSIVSVI